MREHKTDDPQRQHDAEGSPASAEASAHQRARMIRAHKRRQAARAQPEGGAPAQGGAMDPSVAALFDGRQSTDQELGTGPAETKTQADSMRLALQKHLNDFKLAVETAANLVTGSVAGLGKVKVTPDTLAKIGALAMKGVKLAWGYCGGKELSEVVKLAKEEVLGPMAEYAEKANEFVRGQLEKLSGSEATADDIMKTIAHAVIVNATRFITRGKAALAQAGEKELAQSWRLISGTRDNMTMSDGSKASHDDKETVTTEMLEQLTGIQVSGDFALKLTATLLQEARAELIAMSVGGTARTGAIAGALSADPNREAARLAADSGDADWISIDASNRAQAHR